MKVVIFPADDAGCGYHRLMWPAEALAARGHDVVVAPPDDRRMTVVVNKRTGDVVKVTLGYDADVFVFQRTTHKLLVKAIEHLRSVGTTVVVDVDDDLGAIHPGNAAFVALHPTSEGKTFVGRKEPSQHSWHYLPQACQLASLVTVSTPALLPISAAHGRGRLLPNVLAPHYFAPQPPREPRERPLVGWPASLHSHPNDPEVVGPALARLADDVDFVTGGDPEGVGAAFALPADPPSLGNVNLLDWPAALARFDVGLAPLAATKFNRSKSWLKPLELAAAGVPWVGSPSAEYRRLHELGCGVLADRPKDWYRVLRRLVGDAGWRAELANRGREVAATLRLEDHAWRWLEAWSDALALDRAAGAARQRASTG